MSDNFSTKKLIMLNVNIQYWTLLMCHFSRGEKQHAQGRKGCNKAYLALDKIIRAYSAERSLP